MAKSVEIDGREWTAADIAKLDEDGFRGLVSRSRVHHDDQDEIDFLTESWGEGGSSTFEEVTGISSEPEPMDVPTALSLSQEEPAPAKEVDDEGEDNPYPEWTVDELREELGDRGLATSGKKSELIARLEENDETS